MGNVRGGNEVKEQDEIAKFIGRNSNATNNVVIVGGATHLPMINLSYQEKKGGRCIWKKH